MKVFFSYSHMDAAVRDQLDTHCTMLRRNGEIESWHDCRILGGDNLDQEIRFELEHADVVILLVSQHFLASSYCYGVEMKRALERVEEGTCQVLPVIAEVCDWKNSPIGKLKALPKDGKPLSKHSNVNDGLLEVVEELRRIRKRFTKSESPRVNAEVQSSTGMPIAPPEIRSSNLTLRKEYSTADKDRFLFATFDYMLKFFESSLNELQARNSGIESLFRNVSGDSFTCQIYRNGAEVAKCQISVGRFLGKTPRINYSPNLDSNSFSQSLSVEDDGQVLFLKPLMPDLQAGMGQDKLSQEGASELFWSILLAPLQRR